MSQSHLHRHLAPMSDEAWRVLDEEARQLLTHFLVGRKLVDFEGPKGWEYSAVDLGRLEAVATREEASGALVRRRRVQPLSEIRVPFSLPREELEAIERGAKAPDLDPLLDACRVAAELEDRMVFDRISGMADVTGIGAASPHDPLVISDDYTQYPSLVAKAVATLRENGIGGPYGIALGPRCYRGVVETTERGGVIVFEHLRLILGGGPIVWAPSVSGAVVLSVRGGDYQLVSGQDFSLGYSSHDEEQVRFFVEESLTFRVFTPEAGVRLVYEG